MEDRFNAFIDPDLYLHGSGEGPVQGTTFAVKDLYNVRGQVTGFGNPDWRRTHEPATETAPTVRKLLAAGADAVGRTHTDELAYSLNGENHHYGTPVNPNAPGRIPGGSSSGSAAAVAGGAVDFALGTDTGGSVRIPGSYCGVFGLRPTHNRIPLEGLCPLAESFDTIGWFARDPDLLRDVGSVLFADWTADEAAPGTLLKPADLWALADDETVAALAPAMAAVQSVFGALGDMALVGDDGMADWFDAFRFCQGWEVWRNHGDWVASVKPTFGPGIAERVQWTSTLTEEQWRDACAKRAAATARFEEIVTPGVVLVLPTAPGPAPLRGQDPKAQESFRSRALKGTVAAGLAGAPQITLPVGQVDGMPVGLSLLAARGQDELLLSMARRLAGAAENGVAPLLA